MFTSIPASVAATVSRLRKRCSAEKTQASYAVLLVFIVVSPSMFFGSLQLTDAARQISLFNIKLEESNQRRAAAEAETEAGM